MDVQYFKYVQSTRNSLDLVDVWWTNYLPILEKTVHVLRTEFGCYMY